MRARYEIRSLVDINVEMPRVVCHSGSAKSNSIPIMWGINKSGIVALQRDTYAAEFWKPAGNFMVIDNEKHRSYKNPTFRVSCYVNEDIQAGDNSISPFCSWVYVFDTDEIVLQHASGSILRKIKRGTQGFDVAFLSRDDDEVYRPAEDRSFSAGTIDNVMSVIEETREKTIKTQARIREVLAGREPFDGMIINITGQRWVYSVDTRQWSKVSTSSRFDVKVVTGKIRGFGPDTSLYESLVLKEASIDEILKR